MGSRWARLLLAALACFLAGALAATAGTSARSWVAVAVLLFVGVGASLSAAWPLHRAPRAAEPAPEPPVSAGDGRRLAVLQAQIEHLPVAAWLQVDQALLPLSNRARRLSAPGGVCDPAALRQQLCSAQHSAPIVLETERGSERWMLRRQTLALEGQAQTLLVLVPLENELESESLQAWRQLVQILTHEIMNSLTPIRSLSQSALTLLEEPASADDLHTALDAISRRAESLSGFVSTYRRVAQWPAPTMAPVDLRNLFARLQQAIAPSWIARGGEASFELAAPGLLLLADEGQLEQALLALLHNAEQATENNAAGSAAPRLWVQARQGRGGRLQISVRDNGPGVLVGQEQNIFLPFFSTREDGQGIGLTVVRQLVHGMGGRVRHVRPLEGGAAFVLSF
jgi:C4-dicarboxylate-specific signal transduction histidine kinase